MSYANRSCPSFTSDEFKIIAGVKASVGFVTVLMATVTVIVNVASRKYMFPFHRKVLYAGVAVIIEGLSSMLNRVDYLFENDATKKYCVFAGFLNRYANCAVTISSFSIACSIFLDGLYADRSSGYQVAGRRPNSCRLSDWVWLVLIFASPLLFVFIPFLQSAYGQSPGWPWCTVRTVKDDCSVFIFGYVVNLTIFGLILVLLIAVVAMYVVIMLVTARRRRRNEIHFDHVIVAQKKLLDRELQVLAFPALYIAVKFLVILLNLVINRPGQFSFVMWIIYAVVTSASGVIALALTLGGSTCDRQCCRFLLLCTSSDYISEYSVEPKLSLVESDRTITVDYRALENKN